MYVSISQEGVDVYLQVFLGGFDPCKNIEMNISKASHVKVEYLLI